MANETPPSGPGKRRRDRGDDGVWWDKANKCYVDAISLGTGRRDHAMIMLAAQAGLRVSELAGLTIADVHLGSGATFTPSGKDARNAAPPLLPGTAAVLRAWLTGIPREALNRNPELCRPSRPWHACDQGRHGIVSITGGSP